MLAVVKMTTINFSYDRKAVCILLKIANKIAFFFEKNVVSKNTFF